MHVQAARSPQGPYMVALQAATAAASQEPHVLLAARAAAQPARAVAQAAHAQRAAVFPASLIYALTMHVMVPSFQGTAISAATAMRTDMLPTVANGAIPP